MKILWVKAGKLLPVDAGGKIRSYNILRQLQKNHELVLLTHYGGARDLRYETEIRKHFPGAVPVWTAAPDSSTMARFLHYLYCLPSRAPFAVRKFTDPIAGRQIEQLFQEKQFDAAVCDFLSASLTFPSKRWGSTVLFQHNVETVLWERMVDNESNWLKRLVYRFEAAKMRRYERASIGQFQRVIAVSEQDRAFMGQFMPLDKISVVPTGVDLEQYRSSYGGQSTRPLVMFTGTMDFEPNIDGVEYFCREIWPRVLKAVPDARFRIVGKNPVAAVRRLASETIEVTGTVPSVAEHLKEAWVLVVPLRMGGGTRLKIYEGMAMGRAVVSTSIGAEGLEVRNGKDILLSDGVETFAQAVITLLREPELRKRYERAAAELVAGFDWSSVAERFAEVLAGTPPARSSNTQDSLHVDAVSG
jgi:glycosyltransferase involved in cell wall biosynthesis